MTESLISRLRTAQRLRDQQSSNPAPPAGGTDGARASGGPVTGGSTYQVNELGKEAFLSAQGRLSMINAPAFGKWTAPSSGTVIPAHLTKQLNVPRGGVDFNKSASTASAGVGSVTRIVQGASTNNNINNSVTIQSSNPTQSANNVLVQLQRIKRGRLR